MREHHESDELTDRRLFAYSILSVGVLAFGIAGVELYPPETAISSVAGVAAIVGLFASAKWGISAGDRLILYILTRKYHDEAR